MKKKIIVIKIGSSVIMTRRNKLDEFRLSHLADQISTLKEKGFGIILVISGAVACGSHLLGDYYNTLTFESDRLNMGGEDFFKQTAAGIGQVQLITAFNDIFGQKQIRIAQILLDKNDLKVNTKRKRIKRILEFYFQIGIIPIFNENDVVALNSFGGNDFLV